MSVQLCTFIFILVIAGVWHGGSPDVTVHADDVLGTWSRIAPMPTPRAEFAALTGPDGKIYAIGGTRRGKSSLDHETDFLNTVEVYDPTTDVWTPLAPMPTPRYGLTAVTGPDGRIYAMGGVTFPPDAFVPRSVASVEVYSPGSNTWTTEIPMPTAQESVAATVGADGLIYVLGGDGTVDTFSLATKTWTVGTAALLAPRAWFGATTGTDGRIYAAGGLSHQGAAPDHLRSAEVYTIATRMWAPIADMPTRRAGLALATGSDGRIYALGGGFFYPGLDDPSNYLQTVEAYTPITNTWSPVAPMPTGSMAFAAATGLDGRIYALGGWSATPIRNNPGYITGEVTGTVEVLILPTPLPYAGCGFVLGFRALHNRIPTVVGNCLEDERHSPATGDGLQQTTNGLLVWRKADNVVAFTDGWRTWLLGPAGLVVRLNTERCAWELNPGGLPVVACGPVP